MRKRLSQVLARQWRQYPRQHRHPANLLLHLIAVPLFLVALIVLLNGLWHWRFVPLAIGIIGLLASVLLQACGHRLENGSSGPPSGRGESCGGLLLEQLVTFPRFLISGAWWRAWRRKP